MLREDPADKRYLRIKRVGIKRMGMKQILMWGGIGALALATTACTSDTNYGQSQVEPKPVDNANQRRDTTEPGSYGTPTGKDGKSGIPPAPGNEAPAK